MTTIYKINDKNSTLSGCATMTVLAIATMVIAVLLRGWTLSIFWAWFVVATFPGLPSLTIPQALGLALLANIFTSSNRSKKAEKEEGMKVSNADAMIKFMGASFEPVLSTLLIGWVLHFFMPH